MICRGKTRIERIIKKKTEGKSAIQSNDLIRIEAFPTYIHVLWSPKPWRLRLQLFDIKSTCKTKP